MNILHLISSGGMYGAEAVILNLSHELQCRGHASAVASFSNASQHLYQRASAEGLTSLLVPCHDQFSPATLRAIREAVTTQGTDMLHAHGYKADLYAWAALRGSGIPLVSTCHTWYDNDLAVRVYGALDRLVLRRFAQVVAVSAQVEQRLLTSGVSATRIRRIRNGIDLAPFEPAARNRASQPDHPLRVGLVGRLAQEKGVDVFIDAAAIVHRQMPDVEFIVVGEGPDRPLLEEQIRARNLTGTLRLLGHHDAMVSVYAGLDLLVSASRQEGLPIALLEGMASGLPLVATAVGEVPLLVIPGETGLLVAPSDAAALAGAMLHVLGNASGRLAFGQNARRRMEREFSVERMTAEYLETYREALSATKNPGRKPV